MRPDENVKRFFFDLETTGLVEGKDQAIEIGYIVTKGDKRAVKRIRFKPTVPIQKEAYEVHGISEEDLKDEKPFRDYANSLHKLISKADSIVGYNVDFDVSILRGDFARMGMKDPFLNKPLVDPYKIWVKSAPRTLENAYKHFCGKEIADSHSADADIQATEEVLWSLVDRIKAGDWTDQELYEYAFPDRAYWIGGAHHFQWNGEGQVVISFGKKHNGTVVKGYDKDVADYMKWILREDFPGPTKAVAEMYVEDPNNFRDNVIAAFGPPPHEH